MRIRSLLLVIIVLSLGALVSSCDSSSQSDTADIGPTETATAEPANDTSTDASADLETVAGTEGNDESVMELVALIEGELITAKTFDEARTAYYDQYAELYEEEVGGSLSEALEGASGYLLGLRLDDEILEQLTYRVIIEHEIDARGIMIDEDALAAQQEIELEALLEQQGMTEEEFSAKLEELGYPYVQFLADARESIRLQAQIVALKQAIAGVDLLSDTEIDERFVSWYAAARKAATVVVYDPYIVALRARQEDIDLGIKSFEELMLAEDTASPYICYILGGLYQQKYNDALEQLESATSAQAETLTVDADYYGQKALNRLYEARDWLATYEMTDEAIETRIEILEQTVEYDLIL